RGNNRRRNKTSLSSAALLRHQWAEHSVPCGTSCLHGKGCSVGQTPPAPGIVGDLRCVFRRQQAVARAAVAVESCSRAGTLQQLNSDMGRSPIPSICWSDSTEAQFLV